MRDPYQVGGASLAYVSFRRDEFLKLGIYHPECRDYPHGENYPHLKLWMLGYEAWSHPSAIHFHSIFPRRYGKKSKVEIIVEGEPRYLIGNDFVVHNAMVCAYTLGGEKWANFVYEEWKSRGGQTKILDGIRDRVLDVAQEEREWILNNTDQTLEDVLTDLHNRGIRGMEVLPDDCSSSNSDS